MYHNRRKMNTLNVKVNGLSHQGSSSAIQNIVKARAQCLLHESLYRWIYTRRGLFFTFLLILYHKKNLECFFIFLFLYYILVCTNMAINQQKMEGLFLYKINIFNSYILYTYKYNYIEQFRFCIFNIRIHKPFQHCLYEDRF